MGRDAHGVPEAVVHLLTTAEVAELLGVTAGWVYEQARLGRIPHIRLGRSIRFRRETIERWLAEIEQGDLASGTRS